jgi:hypothetical protein
MDWHLPDLLSYTRDLALDALDLDVIAAPLASTQSGGQMIFQQNKLAFNRAALSSIEVPYISGRLRSLE